MPAPVTTAHQWRVAAALDRVRLRSWQMSERGAQLVREVRRYCPHADLRVVARAYSFAEEAHDGQWRRSGDPYISHPAAVAVELARYGADTATIAAALLHDVVEDTDVTRDDVATEFGEDVAELVDGVTKLEVIEGTADLPALDRREVEHAETLRKMVLTMAADLRVVLVKLADRLHNLRTIAPLPEEKRRRKAHETLSLYAPLAHRLGMQQLKHELEDRAFAELFPDDYQQIDTMLAARMPHMQARVHAATTQLQRRLATAGIPAEVTGRPKHHWSIYRKMVDRGVAFDEVLDLIGLRVITPDLASCYAALGEVHALWAPVPGGFSDYIARPKWGSYQSLHTKVTGADGSPMEVQLRTREMHATAEWGVAAHWRYKDKLTPPQATTAGESAPEWLDALVQWSGDPNLSPDEARRYLHSVAREIGDDRVYVFTPAGEVHALPSGASVVDFAYAVHTDIGDHCLHAEINGRHADPETRLRSGDQVHVIRSSQPQVRREWLEHAVSGKARSAIRRSLARRDGTADDRPVDVAEELTELVVHAIDRKGLLVDVAQTISSAGVAIRQSRTAQLGHRSELRFCVAPTDAAAVRELREDLMSVPGVVEVEQVRVPAS